MIEVIKHGKKKFRAVCSNCGCEFTYEVEDIKLGSVTCPDCGDYVAHPNFGNNNGGLYYPPNCRGVKYPPDTWFFTTTGTESKPEDSKAVLTTTNKNKSIVVGDLYSPQGDSLRR